MIKSCIFSEAERTWGLPSEMKTPGTAWQLTVVGGQCPLCQARRNVPHRATAEMPDHGLGEARLFHHSGWTLLGWRNSVNSEGCSKESRLLGFMAVQRTGSGQNRIPVTLLGVHGQDSGVGVECVCSAEPLPDHQLLSQYFIFIEQLLCSGYCARTWG